MLNKIQLKTADIALGAAIWRSRRNMRVDSGPFAPLCENATLHNRKWGLHSILHYRLWRTEPRPQITCTENLVKFGRVVSEMCEQTDGQAGRQTKTNRRVDRNTTHPYRSEVTTVV